MWILIKEHYDRNYKSPLVESYVIAFLLNTRYSLYIIIRMNQKRSNQPISSICDGAFLPRIANGYKPLTIFAKKLHHRSFISY